jgi:hypothetical protein
MRVRQLLCVVMVLGYAASARGVVLYSDNFDSYTPGTGDSTPLDSNQVGPNAGTNGSGNPWWGPFLPNLYVVTSGENGVPAHSGNQMVRGLSTGGDFDQEYYNLQYRHNGGSAFQGNLTADWWFYDPLGSGGSAFQDYGALSYYSSVPTDTDWPANIGSANLAGVAQRLSLGAANTAGNDTTVYQARVVGATDGTINGNGWYNTTKARTVGWHEARISLGDANSGNTQVSFYIDDMVNPLLTHSIVTTTGINILELNSSYGSQVGYYDDVTISSTGGLAGDFNGDGKVDAADYVVWRDGLGTTFQQSDYATWKQNFGKTAGGGASLGASAVPEPVSWLMLVSGGVALCWRRSGSARA